MIIRAPTHKIFHSLLGTLTFCYWIARDYNRLVRSRHIDKISEQIAPVASINSANSLVDGTFFPATTRQMYTDHPPRTPPVVERTFLLLSTVAAIAYALLTIAALLSTVSPLLTSLSSHGKTRAISQNGKNGNLRCHKQPTSGLRRWIQYYLVGNNRLTLNKCRFIDF